MKTVAFISQKGGSGKTTLSIHFAVAAAERGLKVAIIDTDPQESSVAWGEARDKEFPTVASCHAGLIATALEAAKNDGYDLVVVDGAPHLEPSLSRVVAAADFSVIPVRPTSLDLHTAHRSSAVTRASGKPFGFVLNGCPARAVEIPQAVEVLSTLGGTMSPQNIGERRAFSRALTSGEAVTEFDPKGKAAEEINAFYDWVDSNLKNPVTKRRAA